MYEFCASGERGNAEAQYFAGMMYLHGEGNKADYDKAFMWLNRTAEQGEAEAMSALGYMRLRGLGFPVNSDRALYWFQKADEAGSVSAQMMITSIRRKKAEIAYENRDYASALKWFLLLAEQGDAKAQYICAMMYLGGQGTKTDESKVIDWLKKAAEQDDTEAEYALGNLYFDRITGFEDMEENYAPAFYWLGKAAKKGNAEAQCRFGLLYSLGGETIPQPDTGSKKRRHRDWRMRRNVCAKFSMS